MYTGKILGKTIKLWNADYKALKKKWHPDNITGYSKKCFIAGKCTLCSKFKWLPACPDCPLGVFNDGQKSGCTVLLRGLFKRTEISVCGDGTYFRTKKAVVERYMQKLQDMLNTFKKGE